MSITQTQFFFIRFFTQVKIFADFSENFDRNVASWANLYVEKSFRIWRIRKVRAFIKKWKKSGSLEGKLFTSAQILRFYF